MSSRLAIVSMLSLLLMGQHIAAVNQKLMQAHIALIGIVSCGSQFRTASAVRRQILVEHKYLAAEFQSNHSDRTDLKQTSRHTQELTVDEAMTNLFKVLVKTNNVSLRAVLRPEGEAQVGAARALMRFAYAPLSTLLSDIENEISVLARADKNIADIANKFIANKFMTSLEKKKRDANVNDAYRRAFAGTSALRVSVDHLHNDAVTLNAEAREVETSLRQDVILETVKASGDDLDHLQASVEEVSNHAKMLSDFLKNEDNQKSVLKASESACIGAFHLAIRAYDVEGPSRAKVWLEALQRGLGRGLGAGMAVFVGAMALSFYIVLKTAVIGSTMALVAAAVWPAAIAAVAVAAVGAVGIFAHHLYTHLPKDSHSMAKQLNSLAEEIHSAWSQAENVLKDATNVLEAFQTVNAMWRNNGGLTSCAKAVAAKLCKKDKTTCSTEFVKRAKELDGALMPQG